MEHSIESSSQYDIPEEEQHVFQVTYLKLCKNSKSAPLEAIGVKVSENILSFVVDDVSLHQWFLISKALKSDLSLHKVSMESHFPRKTILSANTKKLAESVRFSPPVYTAYVLNMILSDIEYFLNHNIIITHFSFEGIPLVKMEHIEMLCNGISGCESLREICLIGCLIGDNGCNEVCKAIMKTNNVIIINLSNCNIGRKGINYISGMLQVLNQGRFRMRPSRQSLHKYDAEAYGIQRLSLNDNPKLGDREVNTIVEYLRKDTWLRAIDMRNCDISTAGVDLILQLLEVNISIQIVDVRNNRKLPEDCLKELVKKLSRRNNVGPIFTFQYLQVDRDETHGFEEASSPLDKEGSQKSPKSVSEAPEEGISKSTERKLLQKKLFSHASSENSSTSDEEETFSPCERHGTEESYGKKFGAIPKQFKERSLRPRAKQETVKRTNDTPSDEPLQSQCETHNIGELYGKKHGAIPKQFQEKIKRPTVQQKQEKRMLDFEDTFGRRLKIEETSDDESKDTLSEKDITETYKSSDMYESEDESQAFTYTTRWSDSSTTRQSASSFSTSMASSLKGGIIVPGISFPKTNRGKSATTMKRGEKQPSQISTHESISHRGIEDKPIMLTQSSSTDVIGVGLSSNKDLIRSDARPSVVEVGKYGMRLNLKILIHRKSGREVYLPSELPRNLPSAIKSDFMYEPERKYGTTSLAKGQDSSMKRLFLSGQTDTTSGTMTLTKETGKKHEGDLSDTMSPLIDIKIPSTSVSQSSEAEDVNQSISSSLTPFSSERFIRIIDYENFIPSQEMETRKRKPKVIHFPEVQTPSEASYKSEYQNPMVEELLAPQEFYKCTLSGPSSQESYMAELMARQHSSAPFIRVIPEKVYVTRYFSETEKKLTRQEYVNRSLEDVHLKEGIQYPRLLRDITSVIETQTNVPPTPRTHSLPSISPYTTIPSSDHTEDAASTNDSSSPTIIPDTSSSSLYCNVVHSTYKTCDTTHFPYVEENSDTDNDSD